MKTKLASLSSLVLIVAMAAAWSAFGSAAAEDKKANPDRGSVKWEYKLIPAERTAPERGGRAIDVEKTQTSLNKLGEDGWECVGMVNDVHGAEGRGTTSVVMLILKRPKQ